MRFARAADVFAVLIALGAAVTGIVVWNHGTVDIGMTLRSDGAMVTVDDVTPGGNAHRNGFYPGQAILALWRTDGREVQRGDPFPIEGGYLEPFAVPWPSGFFPEWESGVVDELRLPIEAVDSDLIAAAVTGEVSEEFIGEMVKPARYASVFGSIDRGYLEYLLQQSIGVAVVAALVALLIWRLLAHGLTGSIGRELAVPVGAAVAVPALIIPTELVGTPAGIAAGYLVPAAAALVLGIAIARLHPERPWAQTAVIASFVASALAAVLVVRFLTVPSLESDDRGSIVFVVAGVALAPALVVASGTGRSIRERASLLSMGLVPGAALTLTPQTSIEPVLPLVLVSVLIGWQLLPIERIVASVSGTAGAIRSGAPTLTESPADPIQSSSRDSVALLVLAGSALYSLSAPIGAPIGAGELAFGAWAVVLGVALAAAAGFAVRRGFIGAEWTDAALPLAAAVGVPVILSSTTMGGDSLRPAAIPTAIAAFLVSTVLVRRHTDPGWRVRLLVVSGLVVVGTVAVAFAAGDASTLPLIGLIAFIPGVPVAFADTPGEARAMNARLESMTLALTPGIAATMLVPPLGVVLLGAWLLAIIVWRQFALTPMLRLAQRTQLQRDLAVAAAETERARLAADLHDDALQQLSMLVRTLDEAGQKEAADEAREVATKLRSVVGDLRLPILDDLGAGAALEWLVERVEPLAGGPVKLERSDERRPPANVELAVFRVAQEALTNAIKHGRPPIAVRYDVRTDGRVTLAVDDAGEGIGPEAAEEAPRQGHFGLANMQQRAEQIGALLDVRRWPAGGTRVALEWRPQT